MNATDIVEAVKSVVGTHRQVGLHDPFIDEVDVQNVARAASEDPVGYRYVRMLEEAVAERTQRKYAVAVSSGTAALHLALLAVGVKPGDRVLVPTLTFAGVAAAITYCGAKPFIYDAVEGWFGVVTTPFIALDLLGRAAGIKGDRLIIEDAAAALGSVDSKGAPCGKRGAVSIISFNNNKIVTTNGGGMVLTDDQGMADFVRHMATTAKRPSPWFYDHDAIGFNYRMPNLCAALAVGQMKRLDETIEIKRELWGKYRDADLLCPGGEGWNHWLNSVALPAPMMRDVMRGLLESGISCRALYTPLHLQLPYAGSECVGPMTASEEMYRTTLCLPSGRMQ